MTARAPEVRPEVVPRGPRPAARLRRGAGRHRRSRRSRHLRDLRGGIPGDPDVPPVHPGRSSRPSSVAGLGLASAIGLVAGSGRPRRRPAGAGRRRDRRSDRVPAGAHRRRCSPAAVALALMPRRRGHRRAPRSSPSSRWSSPRHLGDHQRDGLRAPVDRGRRRTRRSQTLNLVYLPLYAAGIVGPAIGSLVVRAGLAGAVLRRRGRAADRCDRRVPAPRPPRGPRNPTASETRRPSPCPETTVRSVRAASPLGRRRGCVSPGDRAPPGRCRSRRAG